MVKLIWKVCPKEQGRFASFHKRGWPQAEYENGKIAAAIRCDDSYSLGAAKSGEHGELSVLLYDYSTTDRSCKVAKKRCKTLQEAKDLAQRILDKHPEFFPKQNCPTRLKIKKKGEL